MKTIKLFLKLDFILNPEKSLLQSLKKKTFLNAKEIVLTITTEKMGNVLDL